MARKKKRANQKPVKAKPAVVNDNEEAFLNFVDKNARQKNPELNEKSGAGGGLEVDHVSKFSSSSSSGSDEAFHVRGGVRTRADARLASGVQPTAKKRGRPPKKQKISNKSTQGMSSTSKRQKKSEDPRQDPRYKEEELKASLAVIKEVMEMKEAVSFCTPVDPLSLGIPDYFEVIDTPMDFGTICTNLQNGVKYMNAEDVYKDVQYIWENCLKYNKKGDYIVYLMRKVKKKFTKCWIAAGLQSEKRQKTGVLSADNGTRCSPHDDLSTVDRMVGNISYMQQDTQSQAQAPFTTNSQLYQLHQPQPSTIQPQVSQLQTGTHSNYAAHSHLVGGQVQQNFYSNIQSQSQSQVPFSSHRQPYQSHQPQPSTNQPPQHSLVQDGIDDHYKAKTNYVVGNPMPQDNFDAMQPQVPYPFYGQPHVPPPTYGQSQVPHSSYSQPVPPTNYGQPQLPSSNYGWSQLYPSSYGQPQVPSSSYGQAQVPSSSCRLPHAPQSSYNQHYQPHQPQPSITQPPQQSRLHTGTDSNYGDYTTRHRKRNSLSTMSHTADSRMQHDNLGTIPPQPQVGYSQPYQSHLPHPTPTQPQQLSQLQGDTDTNCAGRADLTPMVSTKKRNKFATRSSRASMMSGPTHSKQQEPQTSSFYPQQNQLTTDRPQPSQSHVSGRIDNAGHSHLLPSMGHAMGHNGYAPNFPVDPIAPNQNILPAQGPTLSHNKPNELRQPQMSVDRPSSSQSLDTVDISSEDSGGSEKFEHGSSAALGVDIPPVSSDSLHQLPSLGPSHPDQSQMPMQKTKKRAGVRGPTLCRDMWDMHDNERIVVPINSLGQPVGPVAAKLSTFLGTVARNGEMAPLTFMDWFAMPDENKEKMWLFVQKKFDIDPLCKPWVLKCLASRWRNWKAKLKAEHYYPHNTDEERLKDRDERVLPDQWPILIAYWNTEEAQLRCAKNKANRANMKGKAIHTSGQKSFARICEEERAKRPDGKELSMTELYIMTHTRKDGQPVSEEAAEMISKLREHEARKEQNALGSNDSDDPLVQAMEEETPADISGKKSGRRRLGRIEMMRMALEAKRSANEVVNKMMDKMEAMEQKHTNMESQIATLTSSLQSFFEKMGEPSVALGRKQVHHTNNIEDPLQDHAHSSSSGYAIPKEDGQ